MFIMHYLTLDPAWDLLSSNQLFMYDESRNYDAIEKLAMNKHDRKPKVRSKNIEVRISACVFAGIRSKFFVLA